jgi:glutamate:GABA antiporter
VIYPGIGTASPDASLPSGFAGQRLQYELSQLVPLGVMILLGLIFYGLGWRTRTSQQSPGPAPGAVIEGLGAGD